MGASIEAILGLILGLLKPLALELCSAPAQWLGERSRHSQNIKKIRLK
jgi:hypothetical protein